MPKVAIADTLDDWEQLLQAAKPYGEIKELKVHLAELQAALDELSRLEAYRNELQAKLQEATQQRDAVRKSGKTVAIQVRLLLKAAFGHSNRRLVQFKIRPRRGARGLVPTSPDPSGNPN
jgi:regulator of replication initiation timing